MMSQASEGGVGLDPRASAVSVDAGGQPGKTALAPGAPDAVPPGPTATGDLREGALGHARPPEWETAGVGGPFAAPSGFRP